MIEDVVRFCRNNQPQFSEKETPNSYKKSPQDSYWISFYDSTTRLSKGGKEFHEAMNEVWIKEAKRLYEQDEASLKPL